MKDSGIEWIGEIPEGWGITKLKYVFKKNCTNLRVGPFGSALSGNDIKEEGNWIYNQRCVLDNNFSTNDSFIDDKKFNQLKAFAVNPGDILITTRGSIGKVAIVPDDAPKGILHPCIIKFVIDDNIINKKILKYLFNNTNVIQEQIKQKSNSTTIDVIYSYNLKEIVLPLPPLAEQHKIADFLDAKCSKIDALKKDITAQIEILEQYKKSVITEAVTKGLNPDVKMKDTGIEWIGEIPEHWKIQKGKYILEYLEKPVKETDGVITCFRDGEVTLRSKRREEGFTISEKEIGYQGIDVGDLVVHGMDGFAGSIGISDSRGKASPVLNVLDSKQNKKYLMYYLRSMAYGDVFLALATGIRVRSCDLRWNKLANLPYPIPPIDEQNQIVAYIDSTLSKTNLIITAKKQQLAKLEDYKKSLIYEYVTGKKQVSL